MFSYQTNGLFIFSMASADLKIIVDIEPIVKIDCIAKKCKHNLYKKGFMCCNLKYVEIDERAQCRMDEEDKS